MERDLDLVREILSNIESAEPSSEGNSLYSLFERHGKDKVDLHLTLLIEAGFV
jgi:hypothetical protein